MFFASGQKYNTDIVVYNRLAFTGQAQHLLVTAEDQHSRTSSPSQPIHIGLPIPTHPDRGVGIITDRLQSVGNTNADILITEQYHAANLSPYCSTVSTTSDFSAKSRAMKSMSCPAAFRLQIV